MLGSTFLTGCAVVAQGLCALVPAAAASPTNASQKRKNASESTAAHGKRAVTPEPLDNDEDERCPPSPTVSDSSSVFSDDSTSALFDSDSESDLEQPKRSRICHVKLAALDLWLSRADAGRKPATASAADLDAAYAHGLALIASEESYELKYELMRDCANEPRNIESDDIRDDRATDRVMRALDDYVALRRTETPRQRAAAASLPYHLVARPYAWPAQTLPTPAPLPSSIPTPRLVDLASIRQSLATAPATPAIQRHTPLRLSTKRSRKARKSRKSQSGEPDALRRQMQRQAVDSALRFYQQLQRSTAETRRRTTSQAFPSAPAASAPQAAPRSRLPVAKRREPGSSTASDTIAAAPASASTVAPRRTARKSYGDIQPRRAPWRN